MGKGDEEEEKTGPWLRGWKARRCRGWRREERTLDTKER